MTCFNPDLDQNIRLLILYLPMVTKATLIVRVIVKNPPLSIKSQCMNLYPFPTTSYNQYLSI